MDARELRRLRLEKIRLGVLGAVEVANLQSRRDVALMAVLLTLGGGIIVAGLTKQLPLHVALPFGGGLIATCGWLGFHMKALAQRVTDAVYLGREAVDTLITQEEEDRDDGAEADTG